MLTEQISYHDAAWDMSPDTGFPRDKCQLVLVFSAPSLVCNADIYDFVRAKYPQAHIITVSTSGEIYKEFVRDESVCVNALYFEKTQIVVHETEIDAMSESYSKWQELAQSLLGDKLRHVIVFSDGLQVNGSSLIQGMKEILWTSIGLTGWLAGDSADFKETFVAHNRVPNSKKMIIVIGFYGEYFQVGKWSVGGWDSFGQKRLVTKSQDNIVYELDEKPVLDLYKTYLWDQAKDLPSSGLLFPLNIYEPWSDTSVVRTLLSINEDDKSITFAWNVPQGYTAQLMKGNFNRIIGWAAQAADTGITWMKHSSFALLVSCVGRKLVLWQRSEEEIEVIRNIIGNSVAIGWFYSYWEVWPSEHDILDCQLHNQTMTLTLFWEL